MLVTTEAPKDLIPIKDAAEKYGRERLGPTGITYGQLRSWARKDPPWITFWEIGGRTFVSESELRERMTPKPFNG